MKSDRRQTILFIIILLVLSMGIGYAFLTTTLTIDGVSDIDSAVWDIHWENVQVQSVSVTGEQVITPATIGNNGTSISFHVHLKDINDRYVILINEVNDGTLIGKIDDIIVKVNGVRDAQLPSYLMYETIYYEPPSFTNIGIGDKLYPGQSRTVGFGLGYNSNVSASDLPTDDETLELSFELVYVQVSAVSEYYYSSIGTNVSNQTLGAPLPNSLTTYDTYQDAIDAFGYSTFIRYRVVDGMILEASVGFVFDGNVYYLVGNDEGKSYESNRNLMLNLFGYESCSTAEVDRFSCSFGDYNYMVTEYGSASVTHNDELVNGCSVNTPGSYRTYICGSQLW